MLLRGHKHHKVNTWQGHNTCTPSLEQQLLDAHSAAQPAALQPVRDIGEDRRIMLTKHCVCVCFCVPTVVRMAPYNLFYGLMLAAADVPSTEVAARDNCGGPRGHSDMGSALTAAVLAAFGADIRPKNPAEYYKYNNNCVRPPGDDSLCECVTVPGGGCHRVSVVP